MVGFCLDWVARALSLIQTSLLVSVVAAQYNMKARALTPVEELMATVSENRKALVKFKCDRAILHSSSALEELKADFDIVRDSLTGGEDELDEHLEEKWRYEHDIGFEMKEFAENSLIKELGMPDVTPVSASSHLNAVLCGNAYMLICVLAYAAPCFVGMR
jgi:hypothetical protein